MEYLAGKLTCKDVAAIITDYLEGAMPFGHRVRFHMHLGLCVGCRNYLRQMRHTIRALGQLPAGPIPPRVREELLVRFRNWKKS